MAAMKKVLSASSEIRMTDKEERKPDLRSGMLEFMAFFILFFFCCVYEIRNFNFTISSVNTADSAKNDS